MKVTDGRDLTRRDDKVTAGEPGVSNSGTERAPRIGEHQDTAHHKKTRVAPARRRPEKTGGRTASEGLYELLAENISDVIFTADMNLRLTYISPSIARLLGMTVEEAMARTITDVLTEPSMEIALAALEALDQKTKSMENRLLYHTEELEMIRKDGSTFWGEVRVNLLRGVNGRPTGLIGVVRDISERKKIESALRESEEKYRELIENINAIVYTTDLDGKVSYISPVFKQLYGRNPDLSSGRSFVSYIHPEDLPEVAESFNQVVSGRFRSIEFRLVLEWSGEVRWVRSYNRPIIVENRTAGVQGFLVDINDQKLAEQALRSSEESLRKIYEKSPIGIVSYDAQGRVTGMNNAALEIFGLSDPAEAGAPLLLDDPTLSQQAKEQLVSGKTLTYEGPFDFTKARGRSPYKTTRQGTVHLHVILTSLGPTSEGTPLGYLLLVQDVTERKMTEGALRESENRYRLVADNVWDVIFTADLELRSTFVTPSVERSLGYSVQEIMTKSLQDILTPPSLELAMRLYREEMDRIAGNTADVIGFRTIDLEFIRKDGNTAWSETRLSFLLDKSGKPTGILGVGRDITKRRMAEEELRRSEEQYRRFVENVDAAFYSVDKQGIITYLSPVFELIYNHPSSDFVGRKFADFIHPEDLPGSLDKFARAMAGPLDEPWECRMVLPGSEKIFWVQGHNRPIRDRDSIVGMQGILVNITQRKQIEQLKDDFIGLVSHELRSPLTVIIGAINTALSEGNRLSPQEIRQLLEDAAAESDSLSHLLGNLLELSRSQANRILLHVEPVRFERVAQSAVAKVMKRYSSVHRVVLDIPRRLPPVQGDQLRLETILYNLLENGVKYSPNGGEIRLSVRRNGDELVVAVKDSGIGISQEEQAKLFRAFQRLEFATSHHVKGAGLGLLVCRRLVEAHGGRIWVESEVNQGAAFYFTLPIKVQRRASK